MAPPRALAGRLATPTRRGEGWVEGRPPWYGGGSLGGFNPPAEVILLVSSVFVCVRTSVCAWVLVAPPGGQTVNSSWST